MRTAQAPVYISFRLYAQNSQAESVG